MRPFPTRTATSAAPGLPTRSRRQGAIDAAPARPDTPLPERARVRGFRRPASASSPRSLSLKPPDPPDPDASSSASSRPEVSGSWGSWGSSESSESSESSDDWRALELFSGLGGWSAALATCEGPVRQARVVAAYDIDTLANATYELNHALRPHPRELATLSADELAAHRADTWLLSPPCQPYCRLGNRRGLEDRRSAGLAHLLELFEAAPPDRLALENVEGFLGSDAHDRLAERLRRHALHALELRLCPTQFGLPNRRPRVFVVASRRPLAARPLPTIEPNRLAEYLDASEDDALYVAAETLARHRPGMDLVRPDARRSACFIGGYGDRYVGSGSFLVTPRGVRRFSPAEIARLLGLPSTFRFPAGLSRERRYRQLGNSLSIPVARFVLDHLDT